MERKEPLKNWEPERIRKAVIAKGLPIDELAQVWGVTKTAIYRSFNGVGQEEVELLVTAYINEAMEEVFAKRVFDRQEATERKERALVEAKGALALVARQVA